jgi:hypothetical protein
MKVDFLIVGAQKCGTSTLFSLLNDHPGLQGCSDKEPGFFSNIEDWRSHIDSYHSLFTQRDDVQYFEASTIYTFYPLRKLNIWDNVFDYNPNMKIIYLVRNPIERIVSSWMHTYEMGWEDDPLEKAIVNNRLYTDITRYYTQISPWITKFGREQVLILDFNDLVLNQSQLLNKVANFLKIEAGNFPAKTNVCRNSSVGDQKVSGQFIKYTRLAQQFQLLAPDSLQKIVRLLWRAVAYKHNRRFTQRPTLTVQSQAMLVHLLSLEIEGLEALIGKNLSKWKTIQATPEDSK